jgi:ketosteroid isomerase-like protein
MSRDDLKLAMEAYAAATARPKPDFETVNRLFDPEHILVPLTAQVDTRDFEGASAFNEFPDLADWTGTIEGAVDFGAGRVVLVTQGEYRGSSSGPSIPLRSWIVATVRNGKLIRSEIYVDPLKALEAAGLSE